MDHLLVAQVADAPPPIAQVPATSPPPVWSWAGMAPADWATLSLTAATLVVAVLAVIVGIGAIFGWKIMRDSAKKAGAEAAERTGKKAIVDYLASDAFKDLVRTEAQGIVRNTVLDHLLTKSENPQQNGGSPQPLKD